MPETVELTREGLDEAIALLIEDKPDYVPKSMKTSVTPKGWWGWNISGQRWIVMLHPHRDIREAKRLTDGLVAEKWSINIYIAPRLINRIYEIRAFSPDGAIRIILHDSTLELIWARLYYEAKTGKKVVVKDDA